MVSFRLISGEGGITLSCLIMSRFFLAFYGINACVIFAKVTELQLGKFWMIGYWS